MGNFLHRIYYKEALNFLNRRARLFFWEWNNQLYNVTNIFKEIQGFVVINSIQDQNYPQGYLQVSAAPVLTSNDPGTLAAKLL